MKEQNYPIVSLIKMNIVIYANKLNQDDKIYCLI